MPKAGMSPKRPKRLFILEMVENANVAGVHSIWSMIMLLLSLVVEAANLQIFSYFAENVTEVNPIVVPVKSIIGLLELIVVIEDLQQIQEILRGHQHSVRVQLKEDCVVKNEH